MLIPKGSFGRLLVIASAVSMLATACGDDDNSEAGSSTAAPARPAALGVAASGLSYELDRQSVPAGAVEVTLTNKDQGQPLPQLATLVRLADGMTLEEYRAFFESPGGEIAARKATKLFGGPGAVFGGQTSSVTVDLEPGTYAVASFMAGPDGVFNLTKGQLTTFTVTDTASPAPLPEADQQLVMHDMSYTFPGGGLKAGATVEVTNAGPQDHEFGMLKLADGATADDVKAFFSGPPTGPPPFSASGGVNGLSPGQVNHVVVPSRGRYVAFCALGDANGGPPHFIQGMVSEFQVV